MIRLRVQARRQTRDVPPTIRRVCRARCSIGIDLHIEVPASDGGRSHFAAPAEGSREVAARVARARDIQAARYAALGLPEIRLNAQAQGPILEEVAKADASGLSILGAMRRRDEAVRPTRCGCQHAAIIAFSRSPARWRSGRLREVGRVHLAEALSYRALSDELRRAA